MITIGFFSNNSFMTNIIKWFTGSPVNHCAIGFVYNGKPSWLEAGTSGVAIVDRGYLSGLYAEFQVIPNIQNEVQLAQKKVGQPYSDLTFFGIAIITVFKWFGIKINNPFYEKSAEICSEFIIEIDTSFLIPEFDRIDPANVSPGDLLKICESGKSFEKLL
jgi:hypothetical protein